MSRDSSSSVDGIEAFQVWQLDSDTNDATFIVKSNSSQLTAVSTSLMAVFKLFIVSVIACIFDTEPIDVDDHRRGYYEGHD
jgi:hypothetical protein